jgi:hypothetical protein
MLSFPLGRDRGGSFSASCSSLDYRRRDAIPGKRGDDMTLEERKRRIETMRRKFRGIHQEMMETAERMRKRLEPNKRHPEKTLW